MERSGDCSVDACDIHPQAVVHPDCEIGRGTVVWQFASIIRRAHIGENCKIASCAIVDGAMLHDRVIVSHGAFIPPGVWIGESVFIGQHVVFCNDAWPRVDREGFDLDALFKHYVTSVVESGASIGARAVILPGVVIGAGAMIGAGTVVNRNVPPHHLLRWDGTHEPIDPKRKIRRMRAPHSLLPVVSK